MKTSSLVASLFGLIFSLTASAASAACTVAVPNRSFNYEGFDINADASALLTSRGYTIVTDSTDASAELSVEGSMVSHRPFNRATITFTLRDTATGQSTVIASGYKSCLFTDVCAPADFNQALRNAAKDLSGKLPACSANSL